MENVCGIINQLLKHGAYVNMPNDRGPTPIYSAISYGALNIAELLLRNGAEVNGLCKFSHGQETVIYSAIKYSFFFSDTCPVEFLLYYGANVDKKVLQYAAKAGTPEVLELLRQHHANTSAQAKSGQPAL